MQTLRNYVNPKQFAITLEQIAQLLGIPPHRILKWERWYNVLWVHIEGKGGYFISYRRLKQWLAACSALIYFCPNRDSLQRLWECIEKESHRYTYQALSSLAAMVKKRYYRLGEVKILSGLGFSRSMSKQF